MTLLRILRILRFTLLCVFASLRLCVNALTLAWNPDLFANGYRLYWATNTFLLSPLSLSGVTNLDAGAATTCRVTNLATNTCYHFALTAYNFAGESDFSDELLWTNNSVLSIISNAGFIAIRWTNRLASPVIAWTYNSNDCDALQWSTNFNGSNWTDIPRTFYTIVAGEIRVSINRSNPPIRYFRRRLSLICTNGSSLITAPN